MSSEGLREVLHDRNITTASHSVQDNSLLSNCARLSVYCSTLGFSLSIFRGTSIPRNTINAGILSFLFGIPFFSLHDYFSKNSTLYYKNNTIHAFLSGSIVALFPAFLYEIYSHANQSTAPFHLPQPNTTTTTLNPNPVTPTGTGSVNTVTSNISVPDAKRVTPGTAHGGTTGTTTIGNGGTRGTIYSRIGGSGLSSTRVWMMSGLVGLLCGSGNYLYETVSLNVRAKMIAKKRDWIVWWNDGDPFARTVEHKFQDALKHGYYSRATAFPDWIPCKNEDDMYIYQNNKMAVLKKEIQALKLKLHQQGVTNVDTLLDSTKHQ
mmetsp:Transcript_9839/g.17737  ORF Transcript_9839/g.17737 Transcript_9839/m.17737 type:complete len:321 (-) Transcript_9839:1334-2296(-)